MSSEANLPEMSAPQAPPPVVPVSGSQDMQIAGEGQQGAGNGRSRRRRRKRKKTGGANASPQGEGQQQNNGGENVEGISASGEAQPQQQQGQQNQQGQGQGKRWKKKKFGRSGGGDRQPRPEPGNSIHANGNGRRNNRQGKQRGPRAFVGPMDHSYREVNGNYADSPPSTIEVHGNHRRGNGRQREFNEDRLPPELLTSARAVAIPEDAPTHIYFFVEDLFLTAKINETSRQQGVKVAFMKPEKDIVAQLADMSEHEHPSLIVFDLNNAAMKALTLIPKLKAKLKKGTSIIGFLNLLQTGDTKMKAMEAGCSTVMTKAAFSQSLPNLIRRYGVVEEEEQNFNQ